MVVPNGNQVAHFDYHLHKINDFSVEKSRFFSKNIYLCPEILILTRVMDVDST